MKILLSLALLFVPMVSFAAIPDFPMAFWGTVTVDGTIAPAGSVVRVYDESVKVGEIEVGESGVYGYTEPTKQKLIVGSGEGELTFTIQSTSINGGVETGGTQVITYSGFVSGETIEKNLDFDVEQEPVVSSGGGGGSSSSGGGSSSRKKVETPTELVLGVATSTENMSEEEQKIILQKKLIELLTLLISLLQQKMLLGTG